MRSNVGRRWNAMPAVHFTINYMEYQHVYWYERFSTDTDE